MITMEFVAMMARYNAWQNHSLIEAAQTLDDEARNAPRGAFFGSITGTFNHLYWGDSIWMHRFAGWAKPPGGIPASAALFASWPEFVAARTALDHGIVDWAERLTSDDLDGMLTWFSGAAGREVSKPKAFLLAHFFNHQTHHRGQIHAMLTAAGAKPGDTDLFLLPARE
jgi:uncharacterized damage-inducible protein DinB